MSQIHILRHGQALHNVDRQYTQPDPPLTALGEEQASAVRLRDAPDLILISPMTRTIQTAAIVFKDYPNAATQIWPDLREAFDATCNKGVARALLSEKFPQLDLSECHELWDYEAHTHEGAATRAEKVRSRIQALSEKHRHIYVVTHRCFAAYLVQGPRFDVCEMRHYRLAPPVVVGDAVAEAAHNAAESNSMTGISGTQLDLQNDIVEGRHAINVDSGLMQDFGPVLLIRLPTAQ